MKVLIELPEVPLLQNLAEIAARFKMSRTALIRRAIEEFLKIHHVDNKSDQAFGLWKGKKRDGIKYQQALRNEWDRK